MSSVRRQTWVFVLIVSFAIGTARARAELLYFAKGGEVQSPATLNGQVVRVEIPGQTYVFRSSDFRKIVPGYSPDREWDRRRASAMAGTVDDRYAAAWWALENGLTPEAVAMVRDAYKSDPKHPPTARMHAALERLAKPGADPDIEPFRAALGVPFSLKRGAHVVLLHRHSEADASERVDLLERVITTCYLMLAAQGIELPVPAAAMASAWFDAQSDYHSFLRSQKAAAFLTTRGYYHPTWNAVIAYDARSTARHKSARAALVARRQDLAHMGAAIDRLSPSSRLRFEVPGEPVRTLNRTEARKLLDELMRDVARRELLLELERRAIDLGTAAHEMVHQLAAESGLAPRHDAFPYWLHEGFAAQFEVIRGGRWAGVGRAHDLRLPDWRAIQPVPPLLPLIEDSGFGHGYQRSLYAQAWALVYFLRKEHPREFLSFVDSLRSPDDDGSQAGGRAIEAFRDAFGQDVAPIERHWHQFISAARTPLEENDPSARTSTPGPSRARD